MRVADQLIQKKRSWVVLRMSDVAGHTVGLCPCTLRLIIDLVPVSLHPPITISIGSEPTSSASRIAASRAPRTVKTTLVRLETSIAVW
jgi:hypothetical protein